MNIFKKLIAIILLIGFSTAHALQFKSFNFNDESACAEQLGQQPVSLPYDIIDVNRLSKSKEICLQAYIGDNACRKEYFRQKASLGLTSGIRSNHSEDEEKQAQQQCGGWLKGRRNACESFLQQASKVCYQLSTEAEIQQQKEVSNLFPFEGLWIGTINKHSAELYIHHDGNTITGWEKSQGHTYKIQNPVWDKNQNHIEFTLVSVSGDDFDLSLHKVGENSIEGNWSVFILSGSAKFSRKNK